MVFFLFFGQEIYLTHRLAWKFYTVYQQHGSQDASLVRLRALSNDLAIVSRLLGGAVLLCFTAFLCFLYRYMGRVEEEIKKEAAGLVIDAMTDPLTGLYNRRGFTVLADQQLKTAKRAGKISLLLYVDLDNMKAINDNLGHRVGDEALIETAAVLKEVFRESDVCARIGGDEFAVLALGASVLDDPEVIKKRLDDQILVHNDRSGRKYELSMSVGAVPNAPEDSVPLEDLMSLADGLMFREKRTKHSRS